MKNSWTFSTQNHEDDSAPRSPGSVESSRHNHSQLGNGNLLHRQTMSVGGRVSWTAIALIVTLVIVSQSEAYVTSPSLRRRSHYSARVKEDSEVVTKLREDGSKVTLYLYPSKRSITAASMKSRRIHRIATPSARATSDVLAASPEQSPMTPVSSNLRPPRTTTKMGMEEEGDDDDGETTS